MPKKSSDRGQSPWRTALRWGASCLIANSLGATGHADTPKREAPSIWPGITFRLSALERLEGDRILIKIRIEHKAPEGTAPIALEGTGNDEIMTHLREDGSQEIVNRLRPAWAMKDATLWEEHLGIQLTAAPGKPGDPHPGRARVRKELAAGEAIEVGAIYQLIPEAKSLRIHLPQATRPLTNIHLPTPQAQKKGGRASTRLPPEENAN